MARLGSIVTFRPHSEHTHLAGFPELAAIVGRFHEDGSADLSVFIPNREPAWMDKVPEGTGPFTWTAEPDIATVAQNALNMAAEAKTTAESALLVANRPATIVTPPAQPPAADPNAPPPGA